MKYRQQLRLGLFGLVRKFNPQRRIESPSDTDGE
jgi:hypothetical protein